MNKIDQYVDVAKKYDSSMELPYRKYVEVPCTLNILKYLNLENKHVLDIACGTGFYTRLALELGASEVLGVDISSEMVNLAEKLTPSNYKNKIEYLIEDAKEIKLEKKYDIITAIWYLHYFPKESELKNACRTIYRSLKPGGSFLTYILNPDMSNIEGFYNKYGVMNFKSDLFDGSKSKFIINGMDNILDCFYWRKEPLENALKLAGFKEIEWIGPSDAPEGINEMGKKFWKDYLNKPRAIHILCK